MFEPYSQCQMEPCLCRPPAPEVALILQNRNEDPNNNEVSVKLPCAMEAPAPPDAVEQPDAKKPTPKYDPICKYGESPFCHNKPLSGKKHEAVKLLLLGHFSEVGFGDPDFNKVNQQDKYDPVAVDSSVEKNNPSLVHALRHRMDFWRPTLPDLNGTPWRELGCGRGRIPVGADVPKSRADLKKQLVERSVGARDRSGMIIVTSGRAAALAEAMPCMPALIWALARGLAVDIFVDPREFDDYMRAIFSNKMIGAVGEAIDNARGVFGDRFPANEYAGWKGELMAVLNLSVVTFPMASPWPDSLPCGFGYNRYLAFRYMCARFGGAAVLGGGIENGRCMMIDDNVANFGGSDYRHLERFYSPGFPVQVNNNNNNNNNNDWVCAVFNPCTAPPSGRTKRDPIAACDYKLDSAPSHGPQISADTQLFIQQVTFWNVARVAELTESGTVLNYDPFFVTGKEDVSFHAKLAARRSAEMYEDKSVHINKIDMPPCPQTSGGKAKDDATTEALVETNLRLCPCLPYHPKGKGLNYAAVSCITQVLALARRYGMDREAKGLEDDINAGKKLGGKTPTEADDRFNGLIAILVRRQNLILEQILAKAIAEKPNR